MAYAVIANIELHRGTQNTIASSMLASAQTELEKTGPQFGADRLLIGRALLLKSEGRWNQALEELNFGWTILSQLGIVPALIELSPGLVRLALEMEKRDLAYAVVSRIEEIHANGWPALTATVTWCRGLIEGDSAQLVEAGDAFGAIRALLASGSAYADAAVRLSRAGHRTESATMADRALDIFDQIGAQMDVDDLRRRLRRSGSSDGRARVRRPPRPQHGWASLTPTENQVCALVVRGLSNPAIATRLRMSPRTVQTHVSHVLVKIGVSSRVQLATAVTRRDMTDARNN